MKKTQSPSKSCTNIFPHLRMFFFRKKSQTAKNSKLKSKVFFAVFSLSPHFIYFFYFNCAHTLVVNCWFAPVDEPLIHDFAPHFLYVHI